LKRSAVGLIRHHADRQTRHPATAINQQYSDERLRAADSAVRDPN
jgi:hypothetical protein